MKIHCDSDCRPCVFEGGPSRDISDQFEANYCPTCRKAFFCDVGVIQHFSTASSVSYSCVDCNTPLLTKSLEEISMLQARFFLKNQSHSSRLSYKQKFIPKKDLASLKSLSMLYDTKSVSTYHRSLIDEIRHISGLSPQVISNFAREYGISETIISNLSGEREEILLTLASLQPKFIEILYAIIIGRDPSIEGGLALRFTVYSENIGDIVFIQPSGALIESGPFDLIAYDHQGMMIWIFCMQETVDADDISKIVNPILNQTLEEFKGISCIYIVAQGFSWVSKQILKKYHGIVIREGEKTRTIPFKLWTEEKKSDQRQILFKSEIL
ncbi:hypothetical protein CEE45_17240 [Candidatus Heimdallarchaeota archaeon B3_Heim]|nr:MAG: hypothetical protein CEE45_17240 [Candidatus Heimdallarchaeota archaeon B3_Heim]